MPDSNNIAGNAEDEAWKSIADQLNSKDDNLDYTAQIATQNNPVTLDIDIHPDRGEDNEKPVTSFSALLPHETNFRFSIEKQGFKQEIGKLFGMQDVIIGNAEFDKKYIIKSNDPSKVTQLLLQDGVCTELLQHPVVHFGIRERKIAVNIELVLLLDLEGALTEPDKLKKLFRPYKIVLDNLS